MLRAVQPQHMRGYELGVSGSLVMMGLPYRLPTVGFLFLEREINFCVV